MSSEGEEGEENVRLVAVSLKKSYSPTKTRNRLLSSLRNSETARQQATPISHPLHLWQLPNLPAGQVKKVVSNSHYFVFLLYDGRVARQPITSSSKRRRTDKPKKEEESFQVQSDAEYARQLQSSLNASGGRRGRGGGGGSLERRVLTGFEPQSPEVQIEVGINILDTSAIRGERESTTRSGSGAEPPPPVPPRPPHPPHLRRPIWPSVGQLQWVQSPSDDGQQIEFSNVTALHSEILLVAKETGLLYAWPVEETDKNSVPKPHPLSEQFGLNDEAIVMLESSECRVTVVTVSGKLATFYDPLIIGPGPPPSLIQSLSHPATDFPELKRETIAKLSVSNFITMATTRSGRVFWWGLAPQAKKDSSSASVTFHLPTTSTAAAPSSSSTSSSGATKQKVGGAGGGRGQILDGSVVRLKNGPPCGPKSVVFTTSATHGPKVGRTVSTMERSSIDAKTSVMVKVVRDSANDGPPNFDPATLNFHGVTGVIYCGLEVWKLNDIVFLDDSPSILGRVVAVDGPQVVVDCSYSVNTSSDLADAASSRAGPSKSSLKVFRLGDLETCIEGPDFLSRGSENSSSGGPSSSSTAAAPPAQSFHSTTRHVAGVVQHAPVCLVDPIASLSTATTRNSGSMETASSGGDHVLSIGPGPLRGFRTLATMATDSGPNLLVERVSDGTSFLVCSSHLSVTGVGGTSFVAVGNHDIKKVKRSTISEEAVDSVECGLTSNTKLLREIKYLSKTSSIPIPSKQSKTGSKYGIPPGNNPAATAAISPGEKTTPLTKSAENISEPTTKSSSTPSSSSSKRARLSPAAKKTRSSSSGSGKGKEVVSPFSSPGQSGRNTRRSSRHVQFSQDTVAMDTDAVSMATGRDSGDESATTVGGTSCEFIPLSLDHPDVFCLSNAAGTLLPLADGLSLVPNQQTNGGPQGGTTGRPKRPLGSYRFVRMQQYSVPGEDIVAVFALVPQKKVLISAIEKGSSEKISPILTQLANQITHITKPAKPVSKTGKTSLSSDTIDTTSVVPPISMETEGDAGGSERICGRKRKIESASESQGKKKLRSMEMEEKAVTTPTMGSVSMEIGGKITEKGAEFDLSILAETGVDNCNIIHVCCGKEGSAVATATETDTNRLSQQKLEILERILSFETLQPIILQLLCSRNAFGHVPFQHAIHHGNYAAALKILEFVITESSGENRKNEFRNLFNEAILDPGFQGLPPLHSLLVKFTTATADITAMKLTVAGLPQGYTAQQFLKLFQKRYSSVYKTKIYKEDEEEEDEGDRSDGDSEMEGGTSGGRFSSPRRIPRGRRRGLPRSLAGRHRQPSLFNSSSSMAMASQRGVVYFSDLSQLRAAAKEMNNFRHVSRSSQSGELSSHVTTVSFLDVRLEEESDQSDDGDARENYLNHPFYPLINPRRLNKAEKEKPPYKASDVKLAHSLFTKLLTYMEVCTAVARGGDTVLTTLVHNPKCMNGLEQAAKCREEDTPPLAQSTGTNLPASLMALADIINNGGTGPHSTPPGSNQHGTWLDMIPIPESMKRLGLLPGFHGNRPGVSMTTSSTPQKPSPLLVSSSSSVSPGAAGPDLPEPGKPVSQTGLSGIVNQSNRRCVEGGVSDSPLAEEEELMLVLAFLKREDRTFANFANNDKVVYSDPQTTSTSFASLNSLLTSSLSPSEQLQLATTTSVSTATDTTSSGASGSQASGSGSSLRLADYVKLEGLPEENRPQFKTSAFLLELLTKAKNTLSAKCTSSSSSSSSLGRGAGSDFNPLLTASVMQKWIDIFLKAIRCIMNVQLHFCLRDLKGLFSTGDIPLMTNAVRDCINLFYPWFLAAFLKNNLPPPPIDTDPRTSGSYRDTQADTERYLTVVTNGLKVMLRICDKNNTSSTNSSAAVETGPKSTAIAMETDPNVSVVEQPKLPTVKTDDSNVVMEMTPSDPQPSYVTAGEAISQPGTSEKGRDLNSKSGKNDFLALLFTNWPCIVTTILGFYPAVQSPDRAGSERIGQWDGKSLDWPSRNQLSSVQSMDSFTAHLILNCDETLINNFTSTIVKRINSCLSESSNQRSVDLLDLSVHDIDLNCVDERVLPVVVGRRFLESVIRILGMEHSRVRNTFVEMQQLRARAAGERGEGGGGGGGGGRPTSSSRSDTRGGQGSNLPTRNIVKVAKSILTQFSWLAVVALARSADIAATPVRLGISKPMGANSVSAEYCTGGGGRHGGSSSLRGAHRHGQPEDLGWTHQRQLHVRSAYHGNHNGGVASATLPLPPSDGITLRPRPIARLSVQNSDPASTGMEPGDEADMGSGHESSFEEDAVSDMEGSGRGRSFSPIPSEGWQPMSPTDLSNLITPQMLGIWTSSSSDEDDEYVTHQTFFTFEPAATTETSPPRQREQDASSPDNIYPFAWALDGRRIGESSNSSSRRDSPFMFGGHHEQNMPLFTIPSIRFGTGFLARTFARFVKDLVDIVVAVSNPDDTKVKLMVPARLKVHLLKQTLSQLESTWMWVVKVLDVAEGQLQRGQNFDVQRHVIALRSDGPSPTTSSHSSSHDSYRSFIGSTPAEYMTYLLRAHAREDADCLPVVDLYGYEHVVFVLDALMYTISHWPTSILSTMSSPSNQNTTATTTDQPQMEHTTQATVAGRETQLPPPPPDDRFFKRSESILASSGTSESEGDIISEYRKSNKQFFGPRTAPMESPGFAGSTKFFEDGQKFSQPLSEAFPLAKQPHLLRPNAKKEELFSGGGGGGGRGCGGVGRGEEGGGGGERRREEMRRGRRDLPVSYDNSLESSQGLPSPITLSLSMDQALQRWHNSISVFAHVFLAEGPGAERDNFLNARAGFASRMARFRQQVSQLYDAAIAHREWSSAVSNSLSLKIRRDYLLQDGLDQLHQLPQFHYSQVRVKFEGEEGSGPGVNRGFFSSFSNELKSCDTSKPVLKQVGLLLSEPGKQPEQSGLYAPCPFIPGHGTSPSKLNNVKELRKKYFRSVGRFLGFCFWFRYTIPLMVCRHVAKYLLGRDVAWHDLAFYNADLYEGLRRMLQDVEEGKKSEDEFKNTYCCYFEAPLTAPLSASVEPFLVDLIPGGSKIPVTPDRVQEYVRLYATFMMYGCVREELKSMKDGLNDVIPPELLSGLTAEDFQLLLSGGSASISLSRLKSVFRFNHTHGSSPTVCDRFEKMFWRVVSHMTNTQRQELLYFATGSGALPSSSETNEHTPSLQITINVIGTGNTKALPVASTCSQRMSIPLYPSYVVLKRKLLQAIQCQAYGLG